MLVRRVVFCLLSCVLVTPFASADDKAPDDLLFRASFDRFTAFADIAQGQPESTLKTSLELRSRRGIKKNCLLLEGDEMCYYAAPGNIDVSGATVSFWVKPENWSDKTGRYITFFHLYGKIKDDPRTFNLKVNKSDKPGNVRLFMQLGNRKTDKDFKQYMLLAKAAWSPDKWVKIDATWDNTHLALYVDGKLANRTKLPEGFTVPELVNPRFGLVPLHRGAESKTHSKEDRTYIDEVEIFKGVQPAGRILKRYMTSRPESSNELPPLSATVPRIDAPTLDGKLDEAAWDRASRLPMLSNLKDTLMAGRRAEVMLGYDDTHIYLGYRCDKQPGKLKAEADHMGKLWLDDSFEWFLSPGAEVRQDYYQFIANSRGSLFDIQGQDRTWTCKGFVMKNHVTDTQWSAEVAIPFTSLGLDGPPRTGDVWRANFARDWAVNFPQKQQCTVWTHTGLSLLAPQRFGRLTFTGRGGGVRLHVAGSLTSGRLDVTVTTGSARQVDVSVLAEGQSVYQNKRTVEGKGTFKKVLPQMQLGRLEVVSGGKAPVLYVLPFTVKQPVTATVLPRVTEKTLELKLGFKNLESAWRDRITAGGVRLTVELRGPAGDRSDTTVKLTALAQTVTAPCAYDTGTYAINYRFDAEGAEPLVIGSSLQVPDVSWVGNTLGITDEVLDPWEPMTYDDPRTINVWRRTMTLQGPLPGKAVTPMGNLLRAPVTMELATPAGRGTLVETSREVDLQKPHRAEHHGGATFKGTGVKAEWSSWMEYDGLVVGTVTLHVPEGGLKVNELTLQMPLKPEVVRFIRGERKHPNYTEWDGKLWQSTFEPFIWVHNDDEGFLYFCESEAGWVVDDADAKKVVTVRGGDDAGITLRIISKPVTVRQPLSYTFGFQATPVKPLPKNLRTLGFGRHHMTKNVTHQPWMANFAKIKGLWDVYAPEAVRAYDQSRKAAGVQVFYYATSSCTPNVSPAYPLFEDLWHNSFSSSYGPYDGKPTRYNPKLPTYYQMPVCPGERTFQDYIVHLGWQLYKKTGATGLYTDTDSIFPCNNTHHGHGFRDQFGKSGVSYTILSKRNLSKRLATICQHMRWGRRRGEYLTHAHSKVVPPVHCWADYFWPGEQYSHQLYGHPWAYVDDLEEEAWRTQFASAPSGLPHVILPQFLRGSKKQEHVDDPKYTESLLAMAAVNDCVVSGSYVHVETITEYWGYHRTMDTPSAEKFIAFWRPGCPVTSRPETSRASVYVWNDRVAVAVANRAGAPKDVTVTLDLEALGLAGKKLVAKDVRTGDNVHMNGNTFTVTLKPRNFTFIDIRSDN